VHALESNQTWKKIHGAFGGVERRQVEVLILFVGALNFVGTLDDFISFQSKKCNLEIKLIR
jgi:hypothetical protein